MKLIIAGSRDLFVPIRLIKELEQFAVYSKVLPDFATEIVHGCAEGIDSCGFEFARQDSIPIKTFKPDWDKHGKRAGPIRNSLMAEYADGLLLIWDGKSKGSKNMLETMRKLNKPVFEVILPSIK